MRYAPTPFDAMCFFRFLVACLVACAALVVARPSRAQSCTPSSLSLTGIIGAVQPTNASAAHTTLSIPYTSINYQDCLNDEVLSFTLGASANSVNDIQVWAGPQDCGALTARQATTQVCWPIAPNLAPITTATNVINIHVRDIIAYINNGTAGGKPTSYTTEAAESYCNTAQTSDAASTINLYFFVADPSSNVCGSEVTYQVTVDLVASGVPGTPTAQAGNGAIYVTIPSTTDTDTTSWNVYTDPPPNGGKPVASTPLPVCDAATATSDASDGGDGATAAIVRFDTEDGGDASDDGATQDAGVDSSTAATCTAAPQIDGGSVASTGGCPSSTVLVDGGGTFTEEEGGTTEVSGGVQSNIPAQYLGVNVGVTSTVATVTGLVNNTTYVVGVAAVDAVGNVGPLALVSTCGADTTPDPVADFWDSYTQDGGRAGGGFCALDGVGVPAGSASFGLALIGAASVLARRRRRSS